jgi:hypothetical protein
LIVALCLAHDVAVSARLLVKSGQLVARRSVVEVSELTRPPVVQYLSLASSPKTLDFYQLLADHHVFAATMV